MPNPAPRSAAPRSASADHAGATTRARGGGTPSWPARSPRRGAERDGIAQARRLTRTRGREAPAPRRVDDAALDGVVAHGRALDGRAGDRAARADHQRQGHPAGDVARVAERALVALPQLALAVADHAVCVLAEDPALDLRLGRGDADLRVQRDAA